jgi:hypothetical protein
MMRMRFTWILAAGALCLGCPGPPARPEPPDLAPARQLGRTLAAVEKYAELYAKATQDDDRVVEARARILIELEAIGAPALLAATEDAVRRRILDLVPAGSDRDLTTAALRESAAAVSKTVDADQHVSGAARQVDLLGRKIARTELRRWDVRDDFEELVYRRLLLECIVANELYALVRQPPGKPKSGHRAAAAIANYGAACKALSDHPATNPEAVKYWDELAAQATTLALQVRAKPDAIIIDREARGLAESNLARHLEFAAQAHDTAVSRIAGNEAVALRLKALEDALRHGVLSCEMILNPTGRQQDAMLTARMDVDLLRGQALKK